MHRGVVAPDLSMWTSYRSNRLLQKICGWITKKGSSQHEDHSFRISVPVTLVGIGFTSDIVFFHCGSNKLDERKDINPPIGIEFPAKSDELTELLLTKTPFQKSRVDIVGFSPFEFVSQFLFVFLLVLEFVVWFVAGQKREHAAS